MSVQRFSTRDPGPVHERDGVDASPVRIGRTIHIKDCPPAQGMVFGMDFINGAARGRKKIPRSRPGVCIFRTVGYIFPGWCPGAIPEPISWRC